MKKVFAVVAVFLGVLLIPASVYAQSPNRYRIGEVSRLGRDEVIDEDYFGSGERVDILGKVNGDVYAAGGIVNIDGLVNGDVLAAGGNVNITGVVTGDIRVAGGQVSVRGDVAGSATILGGSIDIARTASIGKGIVIAGGEVSVSAPIGSSAKIAGGNVSINAHIDGDVDAAVGDLRIEEESKIWGELSYWSDDEVMIDNQATISGSITRHQTPDKNVQWREAKKAIAAFGVFFKVTSLITTLLIGILAIWLFPHFMKQGADILDKNPTKAFLASIIALIVAPIVIVVLAATVIGLPFAVILTFAFVLALYFSRIYLMLWAGRKILKNVDNPATRKNALLAFIVGLIIYYLISLVPILGTLFLSIVGLAAFGASILNKIEYYKLSRKKELL